MLRTIQNIFGLRGLKKRGNFVTFLQIFHRAQQTSLSGVCTSKSKHAPTPPQDIRVDGSNGKLTKSMCVMLSVKAAGHVFTAKTWVKTYFCA